MAEELDAGAVLGTLECPLRERDNLDRVITETKRAGARLMIAEVAQDACRNYNGDPARQEQAAVFRFPKPGGARAFRTLGHHVL